MAPQENQGRRPPPARRAQEVAGAARGTAPRRPARNSIWNKTVNRRNSREWALQMLFRLDVTPPENALEGLFAEFWKLQDDVLDELNETDKSPLDEFRKPASQVYRAFAEELVRGVWQHRDEIDAKIEGYLDNWTLGRMGGVDRNVLRIAFYELFFGEETPPVVVINEAVDVAKYFSTRESGKFVNGVLDRACRDVARPLREGRCGAGRCGADAPRADP